MTWTAAEPAPETVRSGGVGHRLGGGELALAASGRFARDSPSATGSSPAELSRAAGLPR